MRSNLVLLLALSACSPEQDLAVAAPAPVVPKLDPVAKGVPHGAQITQIAVTEQGDAALTFDLLGGLRLWPALDGTRTPVPIFAHDPDQLALAHAGRDLLAVIRDGAGSVSVLRLGRDGSIRARAQLPGDVRYEQVIAIDDGVIARTADHAIESFTADAVSRGRVVVEQGRHIQAIVTRKGRTAALVSDGTLDELRWLDGNRWGKSIKLPRKVHDDLIALAPGGRRIAIVEDKSDAVLLVDLEPTPTVRTDTNDLRDGNVQTLGFIDNDRVAVVGSQVQWLTLSKKQSDPWANTASPPVPSHIQFAGSAVADRVLVTANAASLALTDREQTRYLGYRATATGTLAFAGSRLTLGLSNSHYVWLDDKLAVQRDVELLGANTSWLYAIVIGDHHVVTQRQRDGKYVVELVDIDKRDQPVELGAYGSIERMDYAPESGLLGIGLYREVKRFKLDLEHTKATELAPLRIKQSLISLRLLDPERANGAVAVTLTWSTNEDENYTLSTWRFEGTKLRKDKLSFSGQLYRVEPDGTLYVTMGGELRVRRGSETLSSFKLEPKTSGAIAIDSKGTRYATFQPNELVILDAGGHVQWRKQLWAAQQALFSADDKRVIVRVNGGLIAFDAATGEKLAMECGWEFGITTTAPTATPMINSAPVCEDPTRI